MKSRVDVYANDNTNVHEWDKYSVSDAYKYEWDKYTFHYENSYKWNVYPTVENDTDKYFYWQYQNRISNNTFIRWAGDVQKPIRCEVTVVELRDERNVEYTFNVPFEKIYQQYKLDDRKITNIANYYWLDTNGVFKSGPYSFQYTPPADSVAKIGSIKLIYDKPVYTLGDRNPSGIVLRKGIRTLPYDNDWRVRVSEENIQSTIEKARREQWWKDEIIEATVGIKSEFATLEDGTELTDIDGYIGGIYQYNLGYDGSDIDYTSYRDSNNRFWIRPKAVSANILIVHSTSNFGDTDNSTYHDNYYENDKSIHLIFNTGWSDYLWMDVRTTRPAAHFGDEFRFDGNMNLMPVLDYIRNYTYINEIYYWKEFETGLPALRKTANYPEAYLDNPYGGFAVGPVYGLLIDKDRKSIVQKDNSYETVYPNAPYDYVGVVPSGAIVPYLPYYDIDYTRRNNHIVITDMTIQKDILLYELYLGLDWEDTYPSDEYDGGDFYPPREVFSNVENTFPDKTFEYGTYYKYTFTQNKELDIEWITDLKAEHLNQQIARDNIYYISRGLSATNAIKDDFIETISSYNKYEYPTDGNPYNGYIYSYVGSILVKYVRGAKPIEKVQNASKSAHPLNGIEIGDTPYWYVYKGIRKIIARSYEPSELLGMGYSQNIGSENSFAIGVIGGASVTFDILKPYADVIQYKGLECDVFFDYQNTGDYHKEGRFTIREIKENGYNKTTVVAYDNCYKLDALAKPLLDEINSNTNLLKLYMYICNYCNIPFDPTISFLNENFEIGNVEVEEDTTCRDLMTWIAQLSCSIMVCDINGYMVMKDLTAPQNSRGSNDSANYTLEVSMIPIIRPEGIKFKAQYKGREITVNYVNAYSQWENKLLDFTNNKFLAGYEDSDTIPYIKIIYDRMKALGDVYAWTCKLDNNNYGMVCGDSWVVTSSQIVPRRGIIASKTIDATGITFVSAAGIEAEDVAQNGKNPSEIANVIQEVDNMFKEIHINGIKIYDNIYHELQRTVNDPHSFTIGDTVYNDNELLFDIKSQFDSFYYGDEDIELNVNGTIMIANIVDGYLTLIDSSMRPEGLIELNDVYYYTNNVLDGKLSTTSISMSDFLSGETIAYADSYFPWGQNDYGTSMWIEDMNADTGTDKTVFNIIALLRDGQMHTFNISENDYQFALSTTYGVATINLEGMFPFTVKLKYDLSTKILHIYRTNRTKSYSLTVNSFKLNDGTVLTPESGTAPYTYSGNITIWNRLNDSNQIYSDLGFDLYNGSTKYGRLYYNPEIDSNDNVIDKWGYYDKRDTGNNTRYETLGVDYSNNIITINLYTISVVDSVKLNNLDTLNDTLKVHYYATITNNSAIVVKPNNPYDLNHRFGYNTYGYYETMYLTNTSNRILGTVETRDGQWKINLTSGSVDTISFDGTNGRLTITTK